MSFRPISIRTYLIGLLLALLFPTMVFAGLLLWMFHASQVERYERDALEIARRITTIVDREIASTMRGLQVLATSRLILETRFEELYRQVLSVKDIVGSEVIVKQADGQQLVNSLRPFGTALPVSLTEVDRRALDSGEPEISDLFVGTTSKQQIVAISVPVINDGKIVGLVAAGIYPSRISALLMDQGVPATWTAALVDRKGIIVGRSRQAEKFVGTLATADLRERAVHNEGVWVGWTADGIAVLGAYTRSATTGWRTAVGVPLATVRDPLWHSLALLSLVLALGVIASFVIAHVLARHLARWTEALADSARAIGHGLPFKPPPVHLAELRTLSNVLQETSRELAELQAGLENQVADRTKELRQTHEKLVTEIQQREAAEDLLRHAQKMEAIGQLTGGLAHDFNNLLTVIGGSLQMLQRRLDRGEVGALQRYLENASGGVAKAAALTHRLLAFGRQQPLSPDDLNANELVKGMSDLLQRSLGEAVKVETVLAAGLWRSYADANQLENAILNLALNARDAMPEGGKLTIETANAELDDRYAIENPGAPTGQFVMIAVTDTGIGMEAKVVERAFDPFFTTKGAGSGTGLGLSQVYGFVRQSGGHVKLYSEPGVGTSVKLYLPRWFGDPADRSRTASPGPVLSEAIQGRTVLIVEDEEAVRRLSAEYFAELGYRTLQAEGPEEALRILGERSDIDLLFTDVVMPVMNGKQLADEALKLHPALKVLFTSGYTRNSVVHGGIVDPDVRLLAKPYSIEQLAAKVTQIFETPAK